MDQFLEIVTLPDNVPILLMLALTGFYTWYAMRQALANDRVITELEANPELAKTHHRKRYPWHKDWEQRIHVWPYLLRIEYLASIIVFVLLLVWSITLNAPIEEPANLSLTPNPSKAPWYFLGLQEMLVYFDPWLAGVIFPSLIIVGLMAIPYIDVNEKGNGYYTYKQRKFALWTFFFGFIGLWVTMIVIGTFVRGPGWMWFWPGEYWDSHRIVFQTNVNLHEMLGFADNTTGAYLVGGLVLGGYFVVGTGIMVALFKKFALRTYQKMGPARFFTFDILFLLMMLLPFKMVARIAFNVKYIWTTPFFNW
jgi:hypothetical protein